MPVTLIICSSTGFYQRPGDTGQLPQKIMTAHGITMGGIFFVGKWAESLFIPVIVSVYEVRLEKGNGINSEYNECFRHKAML